MCINCHKEAVTHVVGMMKLGRSAPVEPPARFDADQPRQQYHVEQMGIAGGHLVRLLELTMANQTSDEGEPEFAITPENLPALTGWFSMRSVEQLQTLRVHCKAMSQAFEIAEAVVVDAMTSRAQGGDLEAAAYLGAKIVLVSTPPKQEQMEFEMPKSGDVRLN